MSVGRNLGGLALALVLLTLGLLPAAASAAPAVTTTDDPGPGSLREAIELAAPGETITVPSGDYVLEASELTIDKSLTLAGAGAGTTTIEADGEFRVIKVTKAASEVTLSGVTIRNGHPRAGVVEGGGISSQAGRLTLSAVTVTENIADATAPGKGGGIAEGGGISVHGESKASITVADSTITDNVANASGDSGMSGGIAEGGGLYVRFADAASVSGSTISGNSSLTLGGGIANGAGAFFRDNLGPGSISNSTISGNLVESDTFAEGGGLFAKQGQGPFELDRVTIVGNASRSSEPTARGGGLEIEGTAKAPVKIIAATIVGNSSDVGGNAFLGPYISVGDTVVSGGTGLRGEENCSEPLSGTAMSLGFNLDSSDQCGFHASGDVVERDPQLGPLAAGGGATATMSPAPTSPLVNAGAAFGLTADQRGLARPVAYPGVANSTAPGADGSDIGAVELQLPPPPAPPAPPSRPPAAIGFHFGKLTKNPKKGTATLQVIFSRPATGTLKLAGKGLKARSRAVSGTTTTTLAVAATGKAGKALRRNGRRKIKIAVTFSAPGATPLSAPRRAALLFKASPARHS